MIAFVIVSTLVLERIDFGLLSLLVGIVLLVGILIGLRMSLRFGRVGFRFAVGVTKYLFEIHQICRVNYHILSIAPISLLQFILEFWFSLDFMI